MSHVVSILRNREGEGLVVVKGFEHIVLVVGGVVDGELDHFGSVHRVDLGVHNFIGLHSRNCIFTAHTLLEGPLIIPIDLLDRVVHQPLLAAHFQVPDMVVGLLAGVHPQVVFLRFLLQIVAVVVNDDPLVVRNDDGIIGQGYLPDGQEEIIRVQDRVKLIILIRNTLPKMYTTVLL